METIQELIDFCEAIPEEQWVGSEFEVVRGGVVKRCVAGHINHHLSGEAQPPAGWTVDSDLEPARKLFDKLGINRFRLVVTNNDAYNDGKSPKQAVINYLKESL